MPAAGMRKMVSAIQGNPSDYGLLGGCTEVVQVTDVHELNGTDTAPAGCGTAGQWQDCPSGTFVNPAEKPFERVTSCTFEPITITAGIECSTFGISYEEGQRIALDKLALTEQAGLEDFFMRHWLADNSHTVDLTPVAGALHIVNGIGVLEDWLASNYGGKGVLHAPAGTAALLSMHQVPYRTQENETPTTLMRNCIVLGAGYSANVGPAVLPATAPVPAPAGEAWLFITPPVRVRRDSPSLTTNTEQSQVAYITNDRRAMAETTFVPEVACCMAAAVRVTLSACC